MNGSRDGHWFVASTGERIRIVGPIILCAALLGAAAGSGWVSDLASSTWSDRPALAVAAAALLFPCLLGWFMAQRRGRAPHRRTAYHWLVLLALPTAITLTLIPSHPQQFILDHDVKQIVVPLSFALLLPVVARPQRLQQLFGDLQPMDGFIGAFILLALLAVVMGLVYGNNPLTIGQDAGLAGIFVVCYLVGRTTGQVDEPGSDDDILLVLLLMGAATSLFAFGITPLYSLPIPTAFAGIAYALSSKRHALLGVLGAATLLIVGSRIWDVPKGHLGSPHYQVLAGTLLLCYWLSRKTHLSPRFVYWSGVAGIVAFLLLATTTGSVLTSAYAGRDPSLGQRIYEARQVDAAVNQTATTLLVGAGAGATVDLRGAPDPSIAVARSNPAAVPEVHLLTEEVLWKQGYVGLVWLAAFFADLLMLVWASVDANVRTGDPSFLFLSLMPLLGTLDAMPAATHLYDNPLTPLFLGMLVSRLAGVHLIAAPRPARGHFQWRARARS